MSSPMTQEHINIHGKGEKMKQSILHYRNAHAQTDPFCQLSFIMWSRNRPALFSLSPNKVLSLQKALSNMGGGGMKLFSLFLLSTLHPSYCNVLKSHIKEDKEDYTSSCEI